MRYSSGTRQTRYDFTGQDSYESDFGLLFYNARFYDPQLGRFAQADTIVPGGVQGYDRYAYVNNSPLNFVDPSGHCSEDVEYEEGTLCYFQNMSWEKRKEWLINFSETNELGDWFDDMINAIDFMMNDPSLAAKGGVTEVMDAAVLQAVNDGWLIHTEQGPFGGGGQGWADFFDELRDNPSDQNNLIEKRLKAEQDGVDYSWGLEVVQEAYENSGTFDQIYFDIFKGGADGYRGAARAWRSSDPLLVTATDSSLFFSQLNTVTDPRTSGEFLGAIGHLGRPAAWFAYGGLYSSSIMPPMIR